jgi:hypothetical protein
MVLLGKPKELARPYGNLRCARQETYLIEACAAHVAWDSLTLME